MLYFEDFMEVIEHMPEELRDQLRSIRDLDQGAHAAMNPLSAKINTFFQNCKYSNMSESEKKVEYEKILHEFDKALDYSKEKIAIAEKIFVSYLKAVKKLDSDLTKFRLELEADDSGLTGKVEHRIDTLFGRNGSRIDKRRARLRAGHLFSANRSLQRRRMPFPHDHQDKQYYVVKRRFSVMDTPMNMSSQSPYAGGNGASTTLASQSAMGSFDSDPVSQVLAPDGEMRHISSMGSAGSLDLNGPEHEYSSFNADSPVYGDDDDEDDLQLKFGSGRRRALGNTRLLSHQRHQHQGSYSPYTANADVDGDPSMMADGLMAYPNASPSLTKSGTGESPRWIIGGEKSRRLFTPSARRPGGSSAVFDVAPSSLAGVVEPPADGGGYSTPQRYASHQSSAAATAVASRPSSSTLLQQQEAQASGGDVDDRRYCLCKDVSYGEMIACDAPSCPIEWFHYPCVNLTVAPKGKWICPLCSGTTATNTTGSLVGAGTSSPRYIGSSSSSATPSAVPSTRKRLNRR